MLIKISKDNQETFLKNINNYLKENNINNKIFVEEIKD